MKRVNQFQHAVDDKLYAHTVMGKVNHSPIGPFLHLWGKVNYSPIGPFPHKWGKVRMGDSGQDIPLRNVPHLYLPHTWGRLIE